MRRPLLHVALFYNHQCMYRLAHAMTTQSSVVTTTLFLKRHSEVMWRCEMRITRHGHIQTCQTFAVESSLQCKAEMGKGSQFQDLQLPLSGGPPLGSPPPLRREEVAPQSTIYLARTPWVPGACCGWMLKRLFDSTTDDPGPCVVRLLFTLFDGAFFACN